MVARNNPILRRFACVLEYPTNLAAANGPGLAVLPHSAIERIVGRARGRDQRPGDGAAAENPGDDAQRRELWTIDAVHDRRFVEAYDRKRVFRTGTARQRPGPWLLLTPAAPSTIMHAGASGVGELTLEAGMFTPLLPDGTGYFDDSKLLPQNSKLQFCEYLRMRFLGMHTPFTLHRPYVPMMYQAKMAHCLITLTQDHVIAAELRRVHRLREQRGEPDDGGQDAWANVVRWKVSDKIPGSEGFFRRKLQPGYGRGKHEWFQCAKRCKVHIIIEEYSMLQSGSLGLTHAWFVHSLFTRIHAFSKASRHNSKVLSNFSSACCGVR